MNQFTFELFLQLIGIGSASGLLYLDNSVLVISDDGSDLYSYNLPQKEMEQIRLYESDIRNNIPKNVKTDFEAIVNYNDLIYIFGSGSTENRTKMIVMNRTQKVVLRTVELADLYLTMQSFANINATDFNIEGVVYDGESWYFFQRGNEGSGKNGIFTIKGNIESGEFSMLYNEYKLPKIGGIESSFTDATLVDNKIYFLAAAESTKNSYDDGKVLGSLIGRLDLRRMKVEKTKIITDTRKLEGIAVFENKQKEILFLICEDNDNSTLQSDIFKLTIRK